MYALVDCNTFYASCEQIFNPAIRGQPIVVLSNNDGCIISRNDEAKALKFPGLVPFFQVKHLFKKHQVHIFSSNYELYGDISARVMSILQPFSYEMEIYSIDEAFLRIPVQNDSNNSSNNYQSQGKAIKDALWQQVGMPVCVGIAPTKTLAKLANHAAKKIKKLNGICVLDSKEKQEWLLQRISTKEIWGIGSRLSTRLSQLGIHNGLELINADAKTLRRNFSVVLERTLLELRGKACLDLENAPSPKNEIICSRSFSYKITQQKELEQAICQYAARACSKLRQQQSQSSAIAVYVQSRRKHEPLRTQQRIVRLAHATNDTREISQLAAATIAELYRPNEHYKKCGIILLELSQQRCEQLHFFHPCPNSTFERTNEGHRSC